MHAFSVGGVSHVSGFVQIVANRAKCLILSESFTKPVGAGIFLSFHRSFIDIFQVRESFPSTFSGKQGVRITEDKRWFRRFEKSDRVHLFILAAWKRRRGELQFVKMMENLYCWILVRTLLKWTNLLKLDKIILHNKQNCQFWSIFVYFCPFSLPCYVTPKKCW